MNDILIRLTLVFGGSAVFFVALTLAFAPHVFLVALRFIASGIALIVAAAFAATALLCAGLAHFAG